MRKKYVNYTNSLAININNTSKIKNYWYLQKFILLTYLIYKKYLKNLQILIGVRVRKLYLSMNV